MAQKIMEIRGYADGIEILYEDTPVPNGRCFVRSVVIEAAYFEQLEAAKKQMLDFQNTIKCPICLSTNIHKDHAYNDYRCIQCKHRFEFKKKYMAGQNTRIEDDLLYLTECTLATVGYMGFLKNKSMNEYRRQIDIAQKAIDSIKETKIMVKINSRVLEVLGEHNGSVAEWASSLLAKEGVKPK